jgi:prevent-host-death family protein
VSDRNRPTETVSERTARDEFPALLDRVVDGDTRVIVERDGRALVAIIPAEDLERLRRAEEQRERDFAILDEIGEAFKDVAPVDLEREIAQAIAEVRAENRRRREQAVKSA